MSQTYIIEGVNENEVNAIIISMYNSSKHLFKGETNSFASKEQHPDTGKFVVMFDSFGEGDHEDAMEMYIEVLDKALRPNLEKRMKLITDDWFNT